MGKQIGTAQKLAGFQNQTPAFLFLVLCFSLSMLTLLFQYYLTMFVCFREINCSMG